MPISNPLNNKLFISTVAASLATAVLLVPSAANAAGFALRGQSAYGQGMSFAGMAAGGEISTSFWNPANISGVGDSMVFEGALTIINAETEIETTGASNFIYGGLRETGDVGDTSATPALYLADRINNKTAWGLSLTVPFGLGTEADRGTRSQYVALKSEAESINISPMITYEASPGLNFGFGLQVQKFDVTLSSAIPVGAAAGRFSAADPVLTLEGDDTALGYAFGVNYQTGPTAIGLGYRSSVDHELEGTFDLSALGLRNNIRVDLETPSSINFGIRHQVSEKMSLAASVEKADWSVVGIIPVINSDTGRIQTLLGNPVALPFAYKDTTYYAIGGEYAASSKTTWRAGIGYDETTVSDNTRTTRLPDDDRIWLSVGGSHQLHGGLELDWGFTHIRLQDEAEINIGPGHVAFTGLPYTGKADPTVNILAISIKKTF